MTDAEITRWQEAMATLPDKQFFSIMRLYLGEIKTPYNKQRLVAQLASFVRSPEHTANILALLSADDLAMLTAVRLLPRATQENLLAFFSGSLSVPELYQKIINLTERLLIFSVKDASGDEILQLNPLLSDALLPLLDVRRVFPTHTLCAPSTDDAFRLSPDFLAALVSYLNVRGISCKADGSIKKNDLSRLEEIFGGMTETVQRLVTAFTNLSLAKDDGKTLRPDKKRISLFATLPEPHQYALLCAASVSRFGRDGLKHQAQLLLDCLCSVPKEGITQQEFLRLAFLVRTGMGNESDAPKSRFTRLLETARAENGESAAQDADLLDRMFDSAAAFGLVQKLGTGENGETLFTNGLAGLMSGHTPSGASEHSRPGLISIDSIFTVTVMPGLALHELLPLVEFLSVRKSGVASEYEITRQSASASFDAGLTPQDIFSALEHHLSYDLPQNLRINISEWYGAYSSARLFRGYVLKVAENNVTLAENNPNIRRHIAEKLADGVYLLNFPPDADISGFIAESGLEFLGQVWDAVPAAEPALGFPPLRNGRPLEFPHGDAAPQQNNADALIIRLQKSLDALDLDRHQKESLSHRIQNRLIFSETQLTAAAVRTELLEADGMDFSGKCHLIEAAAKENDLMELTLANADGRGFFTLVGTPLGLSKQPGEAVLRFRLEPTKQTETLLVSRLTHVRRLRS